MSPERGLLCLLTGVLGAEGGPGARCPMAVSVRAVAMVTAGHGDPEGVGVLQLRLVLF